MADRYPAGANLKRVSFGIVFACVLYLISLFSRVFNLESYRDLFYLIWGALGIFIYYRFQRWFEKDVSVTFLSQREEQRKIDLIAFGSTVIPVLPLLFFKPAGLLLHTNLIFIVLWLYIASAYLKGFLRGVGFINIVGPYIILFSVFIINVSGVIKNNDVFTRILTMLSSILFAVVYYKLLDYKRFGNMIFKILGVGSVAWFLFLSLWGISSYRGIAMSELLISLIFIFGPARFLSRSISNSGATIHI